MNEWVPVNEPLLVGNEKDYVMECLNTGWISSEGPFVQRFEAEMAAAVGRKYGVAVCNGTVALELAVAALHLEPGSEVIVPSFTIISCVAAIVRNRYVPVLVDCDPVTWNMDLEQVEDKITSNTRAIMPVHIYGLPVDMDPLLAIANKHNLILIEDASEMLGQTYRGKPCGGFGQISTFSFYANKHITTGEGGMVLTDDDELAQRCRTLRNLGFLPGRRFVHQDLGYNFRLTNLQAAIGLAQLERLDAMVERKRRMGQHYDVLFADAEGMQLPLQGTDYAENIYWVYGLVLTEESGMDATEMIDRLTRLRIGTRPFFWPMHEQPVFRKAGYFIGETYPVAERIARQGFYLPSGATLTEEQRERVAETVKSVLTRSDGG